MYFLKGANEGDLRLTYLNSKSSYNNFLQILVALFCTFGFADNSLKYICPMTENFNRPIRVLVAKVGLDGHDRGAKVIATSLRDAGMEIIYTGLRQTPEMVVNTALQEDVDAIGVSSLSGAHMTIFPKIMQILKDKGLDDVLVTGGGIIPEQDMHTLREMGVGRLFPPGTRTQDIVNYITDWAKEHRNF